MTQFITWNHSKRLDNESDINFFFVLNGQLLKIFNGSMQKINVRTF